MAKAKELKSKQHSTICGCVERVYYASPRFSAGILRTADGKSIRFNGPLCVNEGDMVNLTGTWKKDAKYGPQFVVSQVAYDLPGTPDGLVWYLAKHPAFHGIGESTARKIVDYAGGQKQLEEIIQRDVYELAELKIPRDTLTRLRSAWLAHQESNSVRTYLAGFGLTPHQMDKLIEAFGQSVVGVLRANPYMLTQHLPGYGFKRVDKIALAMGTPKEHAGRVAAALEYLVAEEAGSGHTWISGAELLNKAENLLLLDSIDRRAFIQEVGNKLIKEGRLFCDEKAVALPAYLEAEHLVHKCLQEHATKDCPLLAFHDHSAGLKSKQAEAYWTALNKRIVVISGAAGTGKTHVLARIASAILDANLNVALCSPTGKAAQRIEQSLRSQGVNLEAKTLHRLMEYDGFQFFRESLSEDTTPSSPRRPFDCIAVDETSMVDALLMAELLRRIDFTKTRLILLGDHNQLPPVGAGNVLRDIIQHKLAPTVLLDEVVRQAGVLKTNSIAILSQRIAPSIPGEHAWTVIDHFQEPQQIQVYLRDLVLQHIPKGLGLDPVNDVQIITPTHQGLLGTKELNAMMQRLIHGHVEGRFMVGDKVIQTVNDYSLGAMNGMQGRIIGIEGHSPPAYVVQFEGIGERVIKNDQVNNLQLAYALTAHRAQGSEFPCAVVVCHKSHYFADRNWLYTAVTRASKHCVLIGDRWGLRNAVKKNENRQRRTFLDFWSQRQALPQEVLS